MILRRFFALLLPVLLLPVPAASEPAPEVRPPRLLTDAFPVDVSATFHVGLLHFLDSLVNLSGGGYTGGKTRDAHRLAYAKLYGKPAGQATAMLERFHLARTGYVRTSPTEKRDALTVAFFEASDLDDALARARGLLDPDLAEAFAESLRFFEPAYRGIWKDGRVPATFLDDVMRSPIRGGVADFLAGVARFLGVPAEHDPPPHVHLVPVPRDHGTHAQAVGRHLLIEVRLGEGLREEVAPIVHESTHFLVERIDPERMQALERAALESGRSARAWELLQEALPTAIAQGAADRKFGGGQAGGGPWYHRSDVDAYAKRILPAVEKALNAGAVLDAALVRELVSHY